MELSISSLHRYPLKSGMGESLSEAKLFTSGLEGDRVFMLINARTNEMLTQRNAGLGKLALVQTTITPGGAVFGVQGFEISSLAPPRGIEEKTVKTMVHKTQVRAKDMGDSVAHWFSAYLKSEVPDGVRLVSIDPSFRRTLSAHWVGQNSAVTTHFADAYPVLVTNEASLEKFNEELVAGDGKALPMNRFRPNIVVKRGLAAFEEDALALLEFPQHPGVRLRFVKPCDRCNITTVDQATGTLNGKEPLKTLARMRRWGNVAAVKPYLEKPRPEENNGVIFGVNAVVEGLGEGEALTIREDDVVVPTMKTAYVS